MEKRITEKPNKKMKNETKQNEKKNIPHRKNFVFVNDFVPLQRSLHVLKFPFFRDDAIELDK